MDPAIVAQYQYDPSGVLTGLDEVGSGTAHSLWRVNDVFHTVAAINPAMRAS